MELISRLKKKNNVYFNKINTSKHFPSSVRQWDNILYVYNKNTLSLIPNTTKYVIKLIKTYFNLYNQKLEKKLRTLKISNKKRKFSSNKIYISNGEFKHTNNRVIITLYLFNRQKNNYLLKLKKGYINKWYINKYFSKTSIGNQDINKLNLKKILLKKLKTINIKGLAALKRANKHKHDVIKILNELNKEKKLLKFKAVTDYINKFYKRLINKSLNKIEKYVYYRQLIHINKSKLNYTYLQYIINYLQTFYNKNIEFNLINLKQFYYNSNILSESILNKITKDRKSLLRLLNKLTNKVKIQKKNFYMSENIYNISLKNLNQKNNLLENKIINELKYKHVTGFRLQAKGRLTKKHAASKSLLKLKYKGNLKDIDSSFRGLSTVLLKGNTKSSLQFTKLNSKTRIGSFGVKGWISGN